MSARPHRHVYGPVPSRRLGRSLGIDLVPYKTCSYDCIYCQLGRTTCLTTERAELAPLAQILDELEQRLARGPTPDYISLAGSGEPTLHARLGELIAGIRARTRIPVAVLSNGSLLHLAELRAELAEADLVVPSLDAGTPERFAQVNRPHPALDFAQMVDGLIEFTRAFRGEVWLEVMVLAGLTDSVDEVTRVAELVRRIQPARVQLNTVSRPPAEPDARAVPAQELQRLCGLFPGRCQVIAEDRALPLQAGLEPSALDDEILALLARRPCTVAGIASGLGAAPADVLKRVDALGQRGLLRTQRRGGEIYYERTRTP